MTWVVPVSFKGRIDNPSREDSLSWWTETRKCVAQGIAVTHLV